MKKYLIALIRWIGIAPRDEIYYIGGSDILPPPLKGPEETKALEALEQGDESAKQLLIERNLRLVVFIARRFENTGIKGHLSGLHHSPYIFYSHSASKE